MFTMYIMYCRNNMYIVLIFESDKRTDKYCMYICMRYIRNKYYYYYQDCILVFCKRLRSDKYEKYESNISRLAGRLQKLIFDWFCTWEFPRGGDDPFI